MKYLLIVLMLAGCATVKPVEPLKINPPASAMSECASLTPLEANTFKAVVEKLADLTSLYKECKLKHEELIRFHKLSSD